MGTKELITMDKLCMFCRKKQGKYLCDRPQGSSIIHYHDKPARVKAFTCDARFCEDCGIEVGYDRHFCKACAREIYYKAIEKRFI